MYNPRGVSGLAGGEASIRLRILKLNMHSYYIGRNAQRYNTQWRIFTARTLAEVMAMIDLPAMSAIAQQRPVRALDAGCGTGVLLRHLCERVPGIEAYGVDESADMLVQAAIALKDMPGIHLERAGIGPDETAGLSYAPHSFDLITCTNVLHAIEQPGATLRGLAALLAPGGQLVVEDYARREFPFPWPIMEWLIRRVEKNYVRAYTLVEAQALCMQAGLSPRRGRAFPVDWLWYGWVVST
jgi:SAM-dependent methyltransferase